MTRRDCAIVAVLLAIMICAAILAAACIVCDAIERTRAEIKRIDVQYIENFNIETKEGVRTL